MYSKLTERYAFFCTLVLTFTVAWFFQSRLLLNTDVSWLLEASKRMLAGGNYTNDFFENNPPWILYFYTPPILFEQLFSASIILSLRIYVFLLAAISLGLSHYLLRRVFSTSEIYLEKFLMVILAAVFLVFPMTDFGQREHLLFILIMPYLFMMALRLQGGPISGFLAFSIGLLAGSVLMMKPYFLMALFLVEGYYLLSNRGRSTYSLTLNERIIFPVFRPESIAIFILLFMYITILLLRHTDYLHTVMPFALHWCYLGAQRPWSYVLVNMPMLSCFLPFFFYIALYEINPYKYLTNILLLGLSGFIFSYLIQQEDWAYHILPAISVSIIINLLLFGVYLTSPGRKYYITGFAGIFLLISLLFVNEFREILYFDTQLHPRIFFYFFTGVFISILYLMPSRRRPNVSNMVIIASLASFIGYLFYRLTTPFCSWNTLHLIATCAVLILSFCLLLTGSLKQKINSTLNTLLGAVLFLIPSYEAFLRYDLSKQIQAPSEKLTAFINSRAAHQSIYFFTDQIFHAFPTITYTDNTTSSSRFSFFWALAGLLKQSSLPLDNNLQALLSKDKNFMINMIADDLSSKRTDLVLINAMPPDITISLPEFDYLDYFSENKKFNTIWKNYHYLTTLSASIEAPINPLTYTLKLLYQNIPTEANMRLKTLYLYQNQNGVPELALKNKDNKTIRIKMDLTQTGFDKTYQSAIQLILSEPGAVLEGKNKRAVFSWIAKQSLTYPFYKFNIYKVS